MHDPEWVVAYPETTMSSWSIVEKSPKRELTVDPENGRRNSKLATTPDSNTGPHVIVVSSAYPYMKAKSTAKVSAVRPWSGHPLLIWEQIDNPFHKTSAVYTITIVAGDFVVSGRDEADGKPLKVSKIKWDGESLHFATFFPPTRYSARHVMQLVARGRANRQVDGDREVWKKRPQGRGAAPSVKQSRI